MTDLLPLFGRVAFILLGVVFAYSFSKRLTRWFALGSSGLHRLQDGLLLWSRAQLKVLAVLVVYAVSLMLCIAGFQLTYPRVNQPFASYEIHGLRQEQAPVAARIWFRQLQQCTGADDADFSEISWYSANSIYTRGLPVAGLYDYTHKAIAVVPVGDVVDTFRHEMLHYLLPHASHDSWLFKQCLAGGSQHDND